MLGVTPRKDVKVKAGKGKGAMTTKNEFAEVTRVILCRKSKQHKQEKGKGQNNPECIYRGVWGYSQYECTQTKHDEENRTKR